MISRKEYLKLFYWLHILGILGTAIFQTWYERGLTVAYLPIGSENWTFPSEMIRSLIKLRDYNMSFYFLIGVIGLLFFKKQYIRHATLLAILFQCVLIVLFLFNQYFMSYFWIDIIMLIILGVMLMRYKKIISEQIPRNSLD